MSRGKKLKQRKWCFLTSHVSYPRTNFIHWHRDINHAADGNTGSEDSDTGDSCLVLIASNCNHCPTSGCVLQWLICFAGIEQAHIDITTIQSAETSFWANNVFIAMCIIKMRNESSAIRPHRDSITGFPIRLKASPHLLKYDDVMGWREWLKIWMWWGVCTGYNEPIKSILPL